MSKKILWLLSALALIAPINVVIACASKNRKT